jgi:hypothetical protein
MKGESHRVIRDYCAVTGATTRPVGRRNSIFEQVENGFIFADGLGIR